MAGVGQVAVMQARRASHLAGVSPLQVAAAAAGKAQAGVVLAARGPPLTAPRKAARTLAVSALVRNSARLPLRPMRMGPGCVC